MGSTAERFTLRCYSRVYGVGEESRREASRVARVAVSSGSAKTVHVLLGGQDRQHRVGAGAPEFPGRNAPRGDEQMRSCGLDADMGVVVGTDRIVERTEILGTLNPRTSDYHPHPLELLVWMVEVVMFTAVPGSLYGWAVVCSLDMCSSGM